MHPNWKGRSKITSGMDNIVSYTENPTYFPLQKNTLLELINKFSKIAGHKVNRQIPVAFLYTTTI